MHPKLKLFYQKLLLKILFDKRVGVLTYQTFFENENIVAHEVLSLLEI
jgi:hypothetical protein